MNLSKCLKKMGLAGHEAAIMRALVREEKASGGTSSEAAKRAINKRLAELQKEKSSVHQQILDHVQKNPSGNEAEVAREKVRKPIQSIEDFSTKRTVARAKEVGAHLTEEQAKHIAPLRKDVVTGFHAPEERIPFIERAKEHVKETGESAHYLEADIRNLGGLNKEFGHNGANKHYKAFTDILSEEIKKTGGDVEFIRHGGDEVSAVIVNSTNEAIDAAAKKAQDKINDYTKKNNLSELEHPKHIGEEDHKGTGINYGISEINDRPIDDILTEADQKVERKKLKGDKNVERGKTEEVGAVSSEGQTGRTEEGSGRGDQEARSGEPSAEAKDEPKKEPAPLTNGAADTKLVADKAAREATGERAGRGEEPPGVVKKSPEGNEDNQGNTPSKGIVSEEAKAKEPPKLEEKEIPSEKPVEKKEISPSEKKKEPPPLTKDAAQRLARNFTNQGSPTEAYEKSPGKWAIRPTEKPKLSRSEGKSIGETIGETNLKPIVERMKKSFPNSGDIETLKSTADAPPGLIDHIKAVGGEENVRGAFWNGKVYLFSDNIHSAKEAEFTALHELGHQGLRRLFGNELDPVLKSIYDGSVKVQIETSKLRKSFPDLSLTQAVEEHLADIAGSGHRPGYLSKFVNYVRDFFRKAGLVSKFSDNDILNIVENAKGALVKNEPSDLKSSVPAFSRNKGISESMPDWVAKMPKQEQEALRKAGVWAPKQTLKQRWAEMKHEAGLKVLQGTLDQFAPVLKKIGDYPYKLLRMASSADAGLESSLQFGRLKLNSAGALETIKGTKGFLEVMKPLQGEADRFLSWIAGNRAEQLSKEDREHLFGDADIKALKNLNQKTHAQDNFADGTDGSKRSDVYAKVLKEYNEFSKSILDIAEKSGIIDGESRGTWEKEFYVPFFRDQDEKVTGPNNLSGMVNQYAFKKLKGGEGVLHDLLANAMQNWSHLLNASLKNNAARETLERAADLGIAHTVKTDEKGSVFILKNGEKVHYQVTDPLVLDAVSALGASPFKGKIVEAMGVMKQALTVGTTMSPVFRIRHTIREQITALAANPTTYNFVKNWIDGFKYSSRNNPEYGKMLAGGSFFRMGVSLQDQSAAYVKGLLEHGVEKATVLDSPSKVKAALEHAYEWWKETGERSDSITRANLYRQTYERMVASGMGPDRAHFEAAYVARDAMDYSLRGTWPAIRMVTQVVPFMNARMQGLYKLGRGAVDDPRRFAAVVGGISLASIALMLAYRDDPDFQQREEWDRDNNWWFKIGDNALRVPKPFELGAIGTIVERGLETALNGFDPASREQFVNRLAPIIGGQLNLNPIPQAVFPAIQLWANKDAFTGRAIESERELKLSTAERYSPNTSEVAKIAGKAGVLSPQQIDFLVNAYLGWVGSHVVATTDLALRPLMGEKSKPSPSVDNYFIIGDFVKELPSNQSRFVEQFYDHLKQTQQAVGDLRLYQQTGQIDKVSEAMNNPDLQVSHMYQHVLTSISRINQQARRIQDMDIDPDDKKKQLDKLYQLRNSLARKAEEARSARMQ